MNPALDGALDLALPGGRRLRGDRSSLPLLMGVLNVTPDSFSDGGRWTSPAAAVAHGLGMARAGAAVIDVGGESTRPGAARVDAQTQIARVVPVVAALRGALDAEGFEGVAISIDTTRVATARAAIEAGAGIINDVSAGRDSRDSESSEDSQEAMFRLAAERGAALVLMHMLGQPATMQTSPRYDDVVAEVLAFLTERAAAAEAAGVGRGRIVIDPGLGFGKTLEHNLALLADLKRFVASGYAVLVGASRKRMIAELTRQWVEARGLEARGLGDRGLGNRGSEDRSSRPAADGGLDDRLGGTCAISVLAARAGAAMIRVHNVPANAQALAVWRAVAARSGDV
jgi:dihydropteroate synthase